MSHDADARFFSDREIIPPPPGREELNDRAWRGLAALTARLVQDGRLAKAFPEKCPDAEKQATYATDVRAVLDAWAGLVPLASLPLSSDAPQSTFVALDSLEFFFRYVHKPTDAARHEFFEHVHLRFPEGGREQARRELVLEVNEILSRNGVAIEFGPDGRFRRIASDVMAAALAAAPEERTGDAELDRLLQDAKRKFLSPDPDQRRESLEALWDAFERVKTILPGDKKTSAQALIDAAATHPDLRSRLSTESFELTKIGNSHRIRHSETTQVPLETLAQVDYMFARLWAYIELVAPPLP